MNDKRLKNEYSIDDFDNSKNDFLKAKKLMDNGLYLDAEKILKKLHQQSPNSSAIKLELAHLWIISGIYFFPILFNYFNSGVVLKIPTLIVISTVVIIAALTFFV